jgi:hypothetical protein
MNPVAKKEDVGAYLLEMYEEKYDEELISPSNKNSTKKKKLYRLKTIKAHRIKIRH